MSNPAFDSEQNGKDAQFARSPPNIYLRGKTWWARTVVKGVECRKSLRTTDKAQAATLAADWREELWGHWWYDRPLPTTAKARTPAHAWRNADPRRPAAHLAVHEALREGTLVRQPCEVCGDDKSQGHHDDYDKPLVVRWLCPKHHRAEHRAQRTSGNTR